MFKIAFPWAKHSEEKAEREHLKGKQSASQDEVAGNVWISPDLGEFCRSRTSAGKQSKLTRSSAGVGRRVWNVQLGSGTA